jgi:hypothetical protein
MVEVDWSEAGEGVVVDKDLEAMKGRMMTKTKHKRMGRKAGRRRLIGKKLKLEAEVRRQL